MELRDYLRVLRSHWRGGIAIVLVVLALSALYTSSRPKIYAAGANGFVSTGATKDPALGSVNDDLAKSRATSYVDIATSRATAAAVIKQLGLNADPAALVGKISVQQPLDTVLLKITAKASSPREAKDLADAWVTALAGQVQKIEDPTAVAGSAEPDGVPRVIPVESAELPSRPVSPRPELNLGIGLVLGLVLAFGYAQLRNTLDRKLRSPEDVESRLDTTVVGMVPLAPLLARKPGERGAIVVDAAPTRDENAAVGEAFRKLRTNLLFMDIDNRPRVIVMTSPRPGDGKSTISANLAAAIAMGGERVILIDADLRRPTVASSLGLVDGVGLTDVLVGQAQPSEVLQEVANHRNLQVMAAGRVPPNPSELLGSKTMHNLIDQLSATAIVILDAPPLLAVTDAAVLTANADGALVVISSGKTIDKELEIALAELEAVNGRALGVIMNKMPRKGAGSGYYSNYYGSYVSKPGTGRQRVPEEDGGRPRQPSGQRRA